MKRTLAKIVVVACTLLLIACRAKYESISNDPEFSKYVGLKYKLKSDMDYSGVDLPPGYSNEIGIYVISSRDPGWDGPEVVTRDTLPTGSVITVNEVEECTNCLDFGVPLRHVLVTIEGRSPVNVPVQLNLNQIISGKHLEQIQ